MNFYLQTTNPDEFMEINQAVTLSGIYLTPHDFAQEELDVKETLEKLLEVMSQEQKIYVECIPGSFRSMLEEGKRLQSLSPQIIIVVPATAQGLMTLKAARIAKVPAAVCNLFQSEQVLLASQNPCEKIALNLDQIARFADSDTVIADTLASLDEEGKKRLMAVSLSSPMQLRQMGASGIENVAATAELYRNIVYSVLTQSVSSALREEWIMTYTKDSLLG